VGVEVLEWVMLWTQFLGRSGCSYVVESPDCEHRYGGDGGSDCSHSPGRIRKQIRRVLERRTRVRIDELPDSGTVLCRGD
jgi:hypothetical protein